MPIRRFDPRCLPTAIGSMPQVDPRAACQQAAKYLPSLPFWPQLPNRSFLENMYAQFSQNFPGVTIETQEERIYVKKREIGDQQLESLYTSYLENRSDSYAVTQEYAAGLSRFLTTRFDGALGIKGQVTGPISWGLAVTDEERRPLIYDDVMADAIAKHLRLKARWQERVLRPLSPHLIIFVDEPYLTSLGSAFVSLPRDKVIKLLKEVLEGISGLKGIHCCGNTDWTLPLEAPIDILSFDAYNYSQSLSLYPQEVKAFLEKGGTIAWGIVPNEEIALGKETVSSLQDRFEEAIVAPFARKGIPFKQLLEQALLTPSCGLASLSLEAADRALELLGELSIKLRKRI